MHCQWTLPEGDADFSMRMQGIKAGFSRLVGREAATPGRAVRKRESGIWQRRSWEHTIRDERDYAAHMDYIHWNPVRHGLAARPEDWPHSTFRRCVRAGVYPADWDGSGGDGVDGGERA